MYSFSGANRLYMITCCHSCTVYVKSYIQSQTVNVGYIRTREGHTLYLTFSRYCIHLDSSILTHSAQTTLSRAMIIYKTETGTIKRENQCNS